MSFNLAKRLWSSLKENQKARFFRLFSFRKQQKNRTYYDELNDFAKKPFSYFSNPLSRSKETVKWWVIKFVALIIFIKVAFANAHHLIFTSRSPTQQMQYQQYPAAHQGPDPKTELQLKQVEL